MTETLPLTVLSMPLERRIGFLERLLSRYVAEGLWTKVATVETLLSEAKMKLETEGKESA